MFSNEDRARINDTASDILCYGFGWGYLDLNHLSDRIKALNLYNYDFDIADIVEQIEDFEGDVKEINHWIYVSITQLANYFFDDIENQVIHLQDTEEEQQQYQGALDKLREEFYPFVNCLDSHFSNIFDNTNWRVDKNETSEQYKTRVFREVKEQFILYITNRA